MSPPPNPRAVSADTEVCVTANGPRVAWMLVWVGAGPRWYEVSAAWADGTRVIPPTVSATAAAAPARWRARIGRRERRGVAGDVASGIFYLPLSMNSARRQA